MPRNAHECRTRTMTTDELTDRVLDRIELPAARSNVLLTSGRRVEIAVNDDHDRLIVRGLSGRVIVDIELTDAGPRLAFHQAELALTATRKLSLTAREIAIHADDLVEHIAANRHTRVVGASRLEAAEVQIQADRRGVAVRACESIALDGARIGLNDDPCPQPFPWSALAHDECDDP